MAKFSILWFLRLITPNKQHRYVAKLFSILIGIWLFTSEFSLAFQCGMPTPWDYIHKKCLNEVGTLSVQSSVYGKLVELMFSGLTSCLYCRHEHYNGFGLILFPACIIGPLKMTEGRRLILIASFAFRIT